jgi:class 3 adenylate cyclase
VGVHTGRAYVGTVGSSEGVNEITVLGSAANLAARLSSKAATGEILVSDQSMEMTDLDTNHFETRSLALKGISQPVSVRVIQSKVVGQW